MSGFDLSAGKIFVAGHRGMVGSAVARHLAEAGAEVATVSRTELDLMDQAAVRRWFAEVRPAAVIHAAAKVGGILANNSYPVEFLYENLVLATNVIHAAAEAGVRRLVYLGSSCIYPKLAPQPIPESALLTGPLEPTNEWYAVAKIAGIKLCQAYRREFGLDYVSLMPTNLYGPGDNFSLQSSHVIPALIRKFSDAADQGADEVTVWGTGAPRREFMHVDDLASAVVWALQHYSDEAHLNVGVGEDITIAELARLVAKTVGFEGRIAFDTTKPDGALRKLMDSSRLFATGWRPAIPLAEGLRTTCAWFKQNRTRLPETRL